MLETKYFPHDCFARNDRKIFNLRMKYKQEGYGIYWSLIEMLFENNGKILLTDLQAISFELQSKPLIIQSVINDFNLFLKDENFFWSESVNNTLSIICEKSKKAKISAQSRWNKDTEMRSHSDLNLNAMRDVSSRNAIKERKVNKIKEIKLNEIKENKESKERTSPSIEEVKQYFSENKYTEESANKFFNYYSVEDWRDSKGNEVRSWKQKAQSVWFKEENLQREKRFIQPKKTIEEILSKYE
jgi:hypothetical protein